MTAHHVYRLFDESGALLYVGCTSDVKRRLREHSKLGTGGGERIHDWTVVAYPTRDEALFAEALAIRDERPEVNVRGSATTVGIAWAPIVERPVSSLDDRVAHKVALAAQRLGMTSVALAEAVGMPEVTLSRRLRGSSFLITELHAIAATLGTTVTALVDEAAA